MLTGSIPMGRPGTPCVNRVGAVRCGGESCSEVILRLVEIAVRPRRLATPLFTLSRPAVPLTRIDRRLIN